MNFNWMQWYELIGRVLLALVCLRIISIHEMPRITRLFGLALAISSIVRCGAMIAQASGTPNVSHTIIAIVTGNIPMMTAAMLVTIVWHQIRQRVGYTTMEHSSDAR